MDTKLLEALKERLDRQRAQVCAALQQLRAEEKEAADNNDWAGHVTGETKQKSLGRLVTWYLEELARVEKALGRIESPEYGFCRGCGQMIAPQRLITFPQSDFCSSCHGIGEMAGLP
jgi:RNA polymerase-binding transcription factor DksA